MSGSGGERRGQRTSPCPMVSVRVLGFVEVRRDAVFSLPVVWILRVPVVDLSLAG